MSESGRTSVTAHQMLVRGLLASVTLTVVTGVLAIVVNGGDTLASRLLGTCALATVSFGVLVTLGAARRRKRGNALSLSIAVPALIFGVGALLLLLWFDRVMHWKSEEVFAKVGVTGLFIAGGIAHAAIFRSLAAWSLMLHVARYGTIGLVWLLAVLVIGMVWIENLAEAVLMGSGFIGAMILMMLALAALAGTAVVPIAAVSRANRDDRATESFEQRMPIELGCPRCGYRQTVQAGVGCRCVSCRAVLKVEVEEPRCACGYLLYRLERDACPECGTLVPADQRWSPAPSSEPGTGVPVADDGHEVDDADDSVVVDLD